MVARFVLARRVLPLLLLLKCIPLHAAEPQWWRFSSDHFSVLTEAGQKKGPEIVARFEQMRAVFAELLVRQKVRMSLPIEILATGNPATYMQLVPRSLTAPAFFQRGEDRVFIVVNASVPDGWRAIERPFAHYLLDYNYPPTQPWFDEGFAEYFASLYFTPQKTELGSDPELAWPGQANSTEPRGRSLVEVLQSESWMSFTQLLETKDGGGKSCEEKPPTLFCAQSWILMHYLVSQNKLAETGTYFGLVEIQHLPVAQAVEHAFGMSVAQLEQAVANYFRSLRSLQSSLAEAGRPTPPLAPEPVNERPLPFSAEEVSSSAKQVPLREAQALLAEMALRVPEHRAEALTQLEKLAGDPKTATAVAHRALAWAYVQQGDSQKAFSELRWALQINASDRWSHFGVALAAYHSGQKGTYIQGLANTMESLQIVLDEFPNFAEAYNILGWARLAGGGGNAAVEAMKTAVQLSPRDEAYQLRLARAYLAAKRFDDATATLERLQGSGNPEIARAAAKDLSDLPFLKKYGVSPEEQAARNQTAKVAAKNADDSDGEESEEQPQKTAPAEPAIDKRPVKFLKGTLMSVDCSQAPGAVLLVSSGRSTLRLRIRDSRSATIIGAGQFSCAWKNLPVSVNYRDGGKSDSDLISIEVQ
jgi:tetratricopeptide (TPR) repeat protein